MMPRNGGDGARAHGRRQPRSVANRKQPTGPEFIHPMVRAHTDDDPIDLSWVAGRGLGNDHVPAWGARPRDRLLPSPVLEADCLL